MRKILLYLAYIIVACVLVVILDLFLHSHDAFEVLFYVLPMLLFIALIGLLVSCIILLINRKTKVKTKTIILCLANFLGIIVLGFIYYLAFFLWKGVSWQLVTFGLPLLIGLVFLVIDSIIMIKSNSVKRGWRGFAIGWIALIITIFVTNQLSYLIIPSPKNGPEQSADTQENQLIRLLVDNKDSYWHSFGTFSFFLVQPQFSDEFVAKTPDAFNKEVSDITDHFTGGNKQGKYLDTYSYEEISSLVNNFLKMNQDFTDLSLVSSPKDGYYIDYDKNVKIHYYGIQNEIRWGLIYPSIGPEISISHPFYDEKTKLILVYLDTVYTGNIILFKYENNSLTELDNYMTKQIFD
jgi:hypothetical protein